MANPTATVYADAADGSVSKSGATWATQRGAATGDSRDKTSATVNASQVQEWAGTYYIDRGFLTFDTSSIPDDAVIVAATLYVYANSKAASGISDSLCIVESSQASGTDLTTADYDAVGATELATRVAHSSISTSAYTSFALNASGLAAVSKTGFSKFALRSARDLDNSAPGSSQYAILNINCSEATGTSKDPYLVVEYSASRTAADAIAWSDAAVLGDGIEGGFPVSRRTASDTLAWSDAAALLAAPAARTMVGSPVKVFASNGVPDTFGAHYAFGFTIAYQGTLICFSNKASHHGAAATFVVSKTSSDDGQTWGSEVSQPLLLKARTSNSGTRIHGVLGYGTQPQYIYSDDGAATWSSPVNIDHDFYSNYAYTDDILEMPNGDLLWAAYGFDTSGLVSYSIRTSVSTDGGATWAAQALVTNMNPSAQQGMGESQMESRGGSEVFMTFHDVESPVPTDYYRCRSLDGGATWETPVKLNDDDSFNRQGLTSFANGGVLISYNRWDGGAASVSYVESYDGTTFGTPVEVAGFPVGGYSYAHPLWSMCTALGGEGLSQNVGFTYSTESGAQTSAETYYVQFSGIDGTIVYRRAGSDSLTFTDSPSWVPSFNRTGADSLAFTDTAVRDTLTFARTGADSLSLTDSATGERLAHESTGADTLAWTDTGTRITSTGKTGTDTLAWSDTAARGTYRLVSAADTFTLTDTASGSVSEGEPTYTGPFSVTITSTRTQAAVTSTRTTATIS